MPHLLVLFVLACNGPDSSGDSRLDTGSFDSERGDDTAADTDCSRDDDGDGFLATACATGTDCDDLDPAVNPGATDTCADGVDNDCAGGDASCAIAGTYDASQLDAELQVSDPLQHYGQELAVGDVDGDGVADIASAVGLGHGDGYVAYGPFDGEMDVADVGTRVVGVDDGDTPRGAFVLGDVNGDGYDDLGAAAPHSKGHLVGSPLYIVFGPLEQTVELDAADVSMDPLVDEFGAAAAFGDLDDDDIDDAVIGAPSNMKGSTTGVVYVEYGPLTGGDDDIATTRDAFLTGSETDEAAGADLAAGEDMNGDGIGDLLVGAPAFVAHGTVTFDGVVYLVAGPVSGTFDLVESDARFVGAPEARAGSTLAQGDIDGDGSSDALVGTPDDEGGAGAAYVMAGGSSGDHWLDDAMLIVRGGADEGMGTAVAASDVDGDGAAELLVGAANEGAAFLFFRSTGTWTGDEAQAVIVGAESGDGFASALLGTDLDRDGRGDFLLGAPLHGAGAIYVLLAP